MGTCRIVLGRAADNAYRLFHQTTENSPRALRSAGKDGTRSAFRCPLVLTKISYSFTLKFTAFPVARILLLHRIL